MLLTTSYQHGVRSGKITSPPEIVETERKQFHQIYTEQFLKILSSKRFTNGLYITLGFLNVILTSLGYKAVYICIDYISEHRYQALQFERMADVLVRIKAINSFKTDTHKSSATLISQTSFCLRKAA